MHYAGKFTERDEQRGDLFWRHGSETPPIDRLSNRNILIDVHAMPVLKELVVYLVIERLYQEMATLPASPVTEDRRTVRTILVIDEAHNYLGQKNIFSGLSVRADLRASWCFSPASRQTITGKSFSTVEQIQPLV